MTTKSELGAYAIMFLLLTIVTASISVAVYAERYIVESGIILVIFSGVGFIYCTVMFYKQGGVVDD
jgi:hypothetical protein